VLLQDKYLLKNNCSNENRKFALITAIAVEEIKLADLFKLAPC
jgi:hypothetical protein